MKGTGLRIIACLVLLLAVPVTLGIFAFLLPAQYEHTFLGELKYKYDALRQTPGKRIVVIGGSGVAFGQRSDLMEEALAGYEVINFGMYASLGSTVMLDLAQPLLRQGDIVIFSPEQSGQTLSVYFNPESMWQAVDGRFSLLTKLRYEDLGAMVGQFPYFAARKFAFYRDGNTPMPQGVYSKAAFNTYGDIAYTGRNQNIMSGGFDSNMPITFDELPSQEFLDYVNAFTADCHDRGIQVFYRFCPMNERAVTEEGLEDYVAALETALDCEILGTPRDSILDAGWFYDTNFHLNSAGAVVNTAALVADIKEVLGDPTPVDIELPEMPGFADTLLTQGDDSDAGYFLYETTGGTVRLTGLTGAGKQRGKLTVPAAVGGQPVTGFAPEVFAGNQIIEEITVQSNITRIENGSFSGCTALKRLVVANDAPESCTVGEGLLTGTECEVFVPQRSLSGYLTNYFWSIHASRIRGMEMPGQAEEPVPVTTQPEPSEAEMTIAYHANGGNRKNGDGDVLYLPMDAVHLRANTAQGTRYFEREGYILVGWNTQPDGSGTAVGLGSRIEKQEGQVLYAQWAKESPVSDFAYKTESNEIHITGYLGSDALCVIPQRIDGLPVKRICAGAFRDARIDSLVLPPSMYIVERQAFSGSTVREVTLFDGLYYIYDESFEGCEALTTLHINAMTSPVYSGSYFDAFSDKYDWLLSIREQKKMVLFSGSSGRYGYDSLKLMEAFPEYQVANMGVYAYTNALPQLELIRALMQPGDILLSAPEFDTVNNQFCTTNSLDAHFWAMMESNYDAAALLDLKQYSGVFDSLRAYLTVRVSMAPRDYSVSPNWFDDDGNRYDYDTYNQYGDYVLIRPNSERDELLKWGLADYTVGGFPVETLQGMNAVYRRFLDDGIRVYFTYTPRNIRAITPESTAEARRALHEHLAEHLCVPVISDIEESLYSGIYFYLIDSHLSTEGVAIRTGRIISDLQRQFDAE